ncbi:hypothetical protein MD484_g2332, partial [Candolleomyces efflorescens]
MSALTYAFWSLPTHSYWQSIQDRIPGYWVVNDLLKCLLLCVSTVILVGKSATIYKLLQQRRSQGEKKSSSVYAVVSLVLLAHFVFGTIVYCTNFIRALQKAMCAVASWDRETATVNNFDWMECSVVIENGAIHDSVDNTLRLIFALNAQIILSIVNGVLVYRVREVYSDKWMVYVAMKVLYVLWIVISFIEMYTLLRFDWLVPVNPRLFQLTFNELKHFSFALSFAFNLFVTVAIATRRFLQMNGKSTIPEGGSFPLDSSKKPGLNKAIVLLVDAALPATLCSFVVLVAYGGSVANYTEAAYRVQGVSAVLWLLFSVMAPVLIAIHNLRAEANEFARKAETVVIDKSRNSSLDMDAVAISSLTYSKERLGRPSELKV